MLFEYMTTLLFDLILFFYFFLSHFSQNYTHLIFTTFLCVFFLFFPIFHFISLNVCVCVLLLFSCDTKKNIYMHFWLNASLGTKSQKSMHVFKLECVLMLNFKMVHFIHRHTYEENNNILFSVAFVVFQLSFIRLFARIVSSKKYFFLFLLNL